MASVHPQLLDNLLRLAQSPENEPFRVWLHSERELWRNTLETSRDPTLIAVAQGKAQMLASIQQLLATAVATKGM